MNQTRDNWSTYWTMHWLEDAIMDRFVAWTVSEFAYTSVHTAVRVAVYRSFNEAVISSIVDAAHGISQSSSMTINAEAK